MTNSDVVTLAARRSIPSPWLERGRTCDGTQVRSSPDDAQSIGSGRTADKDATISDRRERPTPGGAARAAERSSSEATVRTFSIRLGEAIHAERDTPQSDVVHERSRPKSRDNLRAFGVDHARDLPNDFGACPPVPCHRPIIRTPVALTLRPAGIDPGRRGATEARPLSYPVG